MGAPAPLAATLTLAALASAAPPASAPPAQASAAPLADERAGSPAAPMTTAMRADIPLGGCRGGGQRVVLSPGGRAHSLRADVAGTLSGEETFGEYCVGYYDSAPHVCLVVRGAGMYAFEVSEADFDTTLALTGGAQEWPMCDDDGAGYGLLSRLEVWLEPGEYEVRVGAYGQHNGASFTLGLEPWQ